MAKPIQIMRGTVFGIVEMHRYIKQLPEGIWKIVRLLIDAGADPTQKRHPFWGSGDTPLDIAIRNNQTDIIELFAEALAN